MDAELRAYLDDMRAELRAEIRHSADEVRTELRQEIQRTADALRTELSAKIEGTADALRTELSAKIEGTAETLRRHFGVVTEGLRWELRAVAEGTLGNTAAIERLEAEMNRRFVSAEAVQRAAFDDFREQLGDVRRDLAELRAGR
jgi:F0F1-type ATP synthase membrane subunit b/b'